MPQIDRDNVAPFISVLLVRTASSDAEKKHLSDIVVDIMAIIDAIDDDVKRTLQGIGRPGTRSAITSAFLHYEEKRRPTWIRGDPPDVYDYINHVIVISQMGELLVFCTSSKPYQDEIAQAIRNTTNGLKVIDQLSLLDIGLLNAALIGDTTRTLWLAGLHKRTAVKADAKVLSGVSLRDALTPLGDQTYALGAVRSELPKSSGIEGTVGVTPRKSTTWTRPSRSWDDFQEQVGAMLELIAAALAAGKSEMSPLPVLATQVLATDSVEGAYDVAIIAPELLADDPNAVPDPLAKRFAYDVRFEVMPGKGPSFQAALFEGDDDLGILNFDISIGADGTARHVVQIDGTPTAAMEEAKKACSKADWLTVYYESGHTLNGETLYKPQFRDMQFQHWEWEDFSNYSVHREKPMSAKNVAFNLIGKEKSLFSWVVNNWPTPPKGATCWMACDDGANEVADFVVLTGGGSLPRALLSLVHVKGSHSKKPNRKLSTSAFEVVVSQAVKNLRALERRNLADFLASGAMNKTKLYAWTNGKPAQDRSAMIKELKALSANYDREVVIVQPSTRRNAYTQSAGTNTATYNRRAQLDTLLLEAETACFALSARLRVIADKS